MLKLDITITPKTRALLVIILVMVNNVEHLAHVHFGIARHNLGFSMQAYAIHSIIVVLIVELAIIEFVRRGKHIYAAVYTALLFVLQMVYYPIQTWLQNGDYDKVLAAVIYCILFTLSIYHFAKLFAEKEQPAEVTEALNKFHEASKANDKLAANVLQLKTELQQSDARLQQRENELQQATATLLQRDTELQQFAATIHQQQIQLQQFAVDCTCPKCARVFSSPAARRSHVGRCKAELNN